MQERSFLVVGLDLLGLVGGLAVGGWVGKGDFGERDEEEEEEEEV